MKLGLWMMGMLMTTNKRLTGGNKMGPFFAEISHAGPQWERTLWVIS